MNAYLVRQLFGLGEKLLYQLPLIKSVYRAFRDFFDFFSPKKRTGTGRRRYHSGHGAGRLCHPGGAGTPAPHSEIVAAYWSICR
ncbi:DUF502 domain-containing protein [Candidatus Reidiella endopervernicosa]|uniref:DUF502 domain-containing protein n=1 Tax=Candidatus Reidiella endopervernicosa TaxID=2738883 RepID=UPI001F43C7DE|nr:DUF502 domain-containing protein [Candidatus Reidiella endopervernicosa]